MAMRGGKLWVLIGAAGVLAAVGLAFWITMSVHDSFVGSQLYQTALRRARTDSRVIDALGEPIEPGWSVSGTLQDKTSGNMSFALAGPKGKADLSLAGSGTHYQMLRVDVEGGGSIDLLDGKGKLVARSDSDCEASELCQAEGRCVLRAGECAAGKYEHCADSARCRKEGACGYDKKRGCVAQSFEHCEHSEGCRTDDKCSLVDGRCIKRVEKPVEWPNKGRFGYPLRELRGEVNIYELKVDGPIPERVMRRVLDSRLAGIAICYDATLQKQADLGGKLTVTFLVDRYGKTAKVATGGQLADAELRKCIEQTVEEMSFPAPEGGVMKVAVGFVLTP